MGISSTRRDYHVHLDCHAMTTDTQYVYTCVWHDMTTYGGDDVLTPVVVCEEDIGAESLTGFDSVER